MDAREARTRRRGFFLHSSDGSEPDTHEHENPEGFVVRVRVRVRENGPTVSRQFASSGTRQVRSARLTGGRSRTEIRVVDEGDSQSHRR